MAKSQARKYREKLAREGNRNPENNRSPFANLDLRTRRTKTKKDYMYQHKHKNQSFNEVNDGSFYFVQNTRRLIILKLQSLFNISQCII